jgi:hypothetical protein
VKVAQFHQQGPVRPVVLTGLTGEGLKTRGLVFRCVLGSEGCVCWFLGPVELQWLRGLGQLGY